MGAIDLNILEQLTSVMRVGTCTSSKTTLWDRNDCANYLRIEVSSVATLIRKNKFPNPKINVSEVNSTKGDRWIAQDIIDWAIQTQFKVGATRKENGVD